MYRLFYVSAAILTGMTSAYTPLLAKKQSIAIQKPTIPGRDTNRPAALHAIASAALAAVLFSSIPQPAMASSNAASQISLNSIPPTSIELDLKDLPVIGKILSGTYTRVADKSIASPSVTVHAPKDKIAALKSIATGGHLEFDVDGVLTTHLDLDVAADQAGVATVRIASPLIPKLPYKNAASRSVADVSAGPKKVGKASDWYLVTNMGNGETYYLNKKTDATQLGLPKGL